MSIYLNVNTEQKINTDLQPNYKISKAQKFMIKTF